MKRYLLPIAAGMIAGVALTVLTTLLLLRSAAGLVVVDHAPVPADAVVVLGGGGSDRLRMALRLYDDKLVEKIVLVGGNEKNWTSLLKEWSQLITMGSRDYVVLGNSRDTRTDAELTLQYCRSNQLRAILVVTSPYHTRRAELVFDDIFDGSGITPLVISSGDFGNLALPAGRWWSERRTLETVWLEVGKILYWELTPFMEFQGTGKKLREREREK